MSVRTDLGSDTRVGADGVAPSDVAPTKETAQFALGEAHPLARVPRAAFDAALRGAQDVNVATSLSVPLRRPPQAFLVRSAADERVAVRIPVEAHDDGLQTREGRERLEARLTRASAEAFGAGSQRGLDTDAIASLQRLSELSAAARGSSVALTPYVELSSVAAERTGRQAFGLMVSAPQLLAYLDIDDEGVGASLVPSGPDGAGSVLSVGEGRLSVGERTTQLPAPTVDALSRFVGDYAHRQTREPSLADDARLLSAGAILG